jgi:CheY-like chemotaxis protein
MYAELLSTSFEIAQAATAAEALSKAAELHPSAIVMDLILPDMPGEDAIVSLKRHGQTMHIPVVVLSGYQEPKRTSPPWKAYLLKPCHAEDLSACLDRIIERTPDG